MQGRQLNRWQKDLACSLGFGLLAILFGLLRFDIANVEGAASDMREIPLFIALFYIRNPLFILLLSISTALNHPPDGSWISTYIFHVAGLYSSWLAYSYLKTWTNQVIRGFAWCIVVIACYLICYLPIMYSTMEMFGVENQLNFFQFYYEVANSVRFEIITTGLISALYLLQHELTDSLRSNVEELKLKNEQLFHYAFINSHLLRAPLAKILGLSEIILHDKSKIDEEIILYLQRSCWEFDEVVKLLAKVVSEKEHSLNQDELDELNRLVQQITNEASKRV